jgi:hypothetical protein
MHEKIFSLVDKFDSSSIYRPIAVSHLPITTRILQTSLCGFGNMVGLVEYMYIIWRVRFILLSLKTYITCVTERMIFDI